MPPPATARSHARARKVSRKRGQQKIDPTRAREIQEALIREHYLDGPASGTWDTKSQSAMERFQADNGWQSKVVPDSRALIKLGLGPDHEHLLNPESAMTSPPAAYAPCFDHEPNPCCSDPAAEVGFQASALRPQTSDLRPPRPQTSSYHEILRRLPRLITGDPQSEYLALEVRGLKCEV